MIWLIYGTNGYTGGLTARLAGRRSHRPVLAGRSAAGVVLLPGIGLRAGGRGGREYRLAPRRCGTRR